MVSSRRAAKGSGKSTDGSIPKVLLEYAQTDGFWDSRSKVKKWCQREGLACPPEQYHLHPPGVRQWCIEEWARREGFVDRWGNVSRRKLEELGIWWGYGSSSLKACHPQLLLGREELNAWRPISAPHIPTVVE